MTNERTETTLGDYLRILRQHRLLIVAVMLVCAAAALGISVLQKPSYDAQASISVRDPNADVTLLGGAGASIETPAQLAAAHAAQVTRPDVVSRVKADLNSPLTVGALRKSVNVNVDPSSELVDVDAQSGNAANAAAIANTFVRVDVALTTEDERHAFGVEARQLAAKIRSLGAAGTNATTAAIYTDQLSRLQSLSAVAQPVQVSSTAGVPTSPSSPRPVRNSVAAALFGLMLGIALAYGRQALDHRLRDAEEIEAHFDMPLLGNVRKRALGSAGLTSARREPLEGADVEAFRILRQNLEYLAVGQSLRSIVVTSAMPKEGKSTVAACLAFASAAAGKRTLLLECDLHRPVLSDRLGLDELGLTDYLLGNAEPEEILQQVPVSLTPTLSGTNGSGLEMARQLTCVMAGNPVPRPADVLASSRFRSMLTEVSEVYDTVILDSSPLLSVVDTLELIPHVSAVLMCGRCNQTTRDQAKAAMAALGRLPSKPTGLVVTGVSATGGGNYGYYYAEASQERTTA